MSNESNSSGIAQLKLKKKFFLLIKISKKYNKRIE